MRQKLATALESVSTDRHKLVILLGGFGTGKTQLLKELAADIGADYINLNLELTERLLARPRRVYRDGVTVNDLIDALCDERSPDKRPLFVDNVELLFSPELGRLNPVDTFKRMSRQRPVVLALPARRQGAEAVYSTVERADYMRMPLEAYVVLEM